MNKSSLIGLFAITLVMLIVVLLLQSKDETISTGNLFVPEVSSNLDDIRSLVLRNGTDQLNIQQESSGDWVLQQAENYLVDTGRLAEFLRTIAAAETIEEKTSKAEYYARLGVEEVSSEGNTTEVVLDWGGGNAAILFGDTQGSYRYARHVDQPTAWLVDADVNLSLDISAWLNTELIDIDAGDVLDVNIMHSDGESVSIIRGDGAGYRLADLPEGRTLKYTSILDPIVSLLSGLNFDQVRAQVVDSEQEAKLADTTTTVKLSDDTNIVFSRFVETFVETEEEVSWFRSEIMPSDQPSTVLSAAELEAFRRAVEGWEFQFAKFKADQFVQTLENLLAPQE
jgi:hypothetical protein